MSEWILKSEKLDENEIKELNKELRELSLQVYNNSTWKSVPALEDLANVLRVDRLSSLTIDPLFSFSILNMYIYAQSFSHFTLNDVVEATVMTMGRAFRNIIGNTLEIEDIRDFKRENNFEELFPRENKEKRKLFYKDLGTKLSSCSRNEDNGGYENTYPHLLLRLLVEKGLKAKWNPKEPAFKRLNERDLSSITFEIETNGEGEHKKEMSLFEYLLLLLADFLNTSPDSVPRYFNYRLLNHHLLRDVLYALYFRSVFKKIIDWAPVLPSFNFDLLNFDLDSPSFKGLSGNIRIVDDILYGLHVGESTMDFLVKVLNIGISPENILQSWKESRDDLGYSKYPSLLFMPVYPDPTFWGDYQKFLMDRHARNDGHIIVFFLPTFYDILRFLTYYPKYACKDEKSGEKIGDIEGAYREVYKRIGYYIREVIE